MVIVNGRRLADPRPITVGHVIESVQVRHHLRVGGVHDWSDGIPTQLGAGNVKGLREAEQFVHSHLGVRHTRELMLNDVFPTHLPPGHRPDASSNDRPALALLSLKAERFRHRHRLGLGITARASVQSECDDQNRQVPLHLSVSSVISQALKRSKLEYSLEIFRFSLLINPTFTNKMKPKTILYYTRFYPNCQVSKLSRLL